MSLMLFWLPLALMSASPAPEPALPQWMAGCWVQEEGERWTEECWTTPRGGVILGSGRSGRGEKLASFEVMQIILTPAHDGQAAAMTFWGAPGGEGRTSFAWQPSSDPGVTFINAAHDYPQRIRYWREGDMLLAETSLSDGSNANRWSYRRAE